MAILNTLTVNGVTYKVAQPVPVVDITLSASAWVDGDKGYSQVVSVPGVTAKSQVNLTPSLEQIDIFYEKDITFVTENDGGKITVYVIGQKPENSYTIPAKIVEVVSDSKKIYGTLVTTPLSPDKIAPKNVVKTVNNVAPDETGNVVVSGTDGKSAYEYAREAGYAGTEAEFAEKLAEEHLKAVYVTVSLNESGGAYEADKTAAELLEAHSAGKLLYCIFPMEGMSCVLPYLTSVDEDGYSVILFGSILDNSSLSVGIDSTGTVAASSTTLAGANKALTLNIGNSMISYDGTSAKSLSVTSLKNPYAMTIGETTYDGSEEVDMTAQINAMINNALGVIEDGTY